MDSQYYQVEQVRQVAGWGLIGSVGPGGSGRGRMLAVVATVALALAVATAIKRPAPDFAAPPIAVMRDAAGQAWWTIRLAPAAHEIAADARAAALPAGHRYWLWLATPEGPRSLGVLPRSGRKIIPEIPTLVATLTGTGEIIVSAEPPRGPSPCQPSGAVMFRVAFPVR